MAYQDTPRASKGNAFCWNQWRPQINWRAGDAQARSGRARSQQIDQARAAGKPDPLPLAGMGNAAALGPLDAARFAIARIKKGARRG